MGLRMGERRALTEQVARRYRSAGKNEKAVMLGEFVQTTGYTRKYAIHLLNSWGRTRLVQIDGQMVKLVVGRPRRAKRRARPRRYDQEVLKALKQIWYVFDFMCGKRLVVVLRTMLAVLDSFGEIPLTAEVRAKLLTISAATIDRLLQRERARLSLKGRSHTKPGTLLKHHVDTGWVELHGLKNKAQRWTHAALQDARLTLPIPIKGTDTDNGSEFINHHLVGYCRKHQISFTRGRPYRKNDTCYVEQKNGHVVRRAVRLPALRHRRRAGRPQRGVRHAQRPGRLLLPLGEADQEDPLRQQGAPHL